MSSGWHSTLTISHPDEILPIAMSSGWLTAQAMSQLHIMHMILGLARTLDLHITIPLWGNPPVMRLFETDTALSEDWTSCWSIKSNRWWVQKLQHSYDVTVMSERDIEQLTLCSKIRNKRRGEISLISLNSRLFQHQYHLDNFRWNQSRKGVQFVDIPVSLI